jgi:hypothetical protein
MASWNRDTPWRQGHVLKSESSVALGLVPPETVGSAFAVIISHDCDLAQLPESEPFVEIIVAEKISKANGNYTHTKNARRLHLPCVASGAAAYLDLRAQAKTTIKKTDLAGHTPAESVVVQPKDRDTLQRWLSARYYRAAFAEQFEKRMADTGLSDRIAKILEPLGKHLIAVFFDVDEGVEKIRNDSTDLYALGIILLYSTHEDPAIALKAAEEAAIAISAEFQKRCFEPVAGWKWIELVGCDPVSAEAMTYEMSTHLKQWNTDYLSLRADPPTQPMLT